MARFLKRILQLACLLQIGLFVPAALANSVEEVLSYKDAPFGVVFEIISTDEDHLQQTLPKVKKAIAQLRQRFPELSIAVVSHGKEQFALTSENREDYEETHQQVQSLVQDKDTTFHVCGTFASMHNVSEEEFPDYVDVAAHGPMQIKNYVEFGYVKILMD